MRTQRRSARGVFRAQPFHQRKRFVLGGTGPASFSIIGDGPIALTSASAIVEGRVFAGDGPIAITSAASAMLEGRVFVGDGPIALTAASGMIGPENAIDGAGQIAMTSAAAMVEGRALAGAGPIALTSAGAMVEGRVFTGAGPIALTSAATFTPPAAAATIQDVIDKLCIMLQGKRITDPVTGVMSQYDLDGLVAYAGPVYEDADGTIPYRGQGIDHQGQLDPP